MKLVENLKAVNTGNRKHISEPLHKIVYGAKPSSDPYLRAMCANEYSITITLGATQWIDEDVVVKSGGKAVESAVKTMKHRIVELVYGELYRELRELQYELQNELYDRESPSRTKLAKIIESITI